MPPQMLWPKIQELAFKYLRWRSSSLVAFLQLLLSPWSNSLSNKDWVEYRALMQMTSLFWTRHPRLWTQLCHCRHPHAFPWQGLLRFKLTLNSIFRAAALFYRKNYHSTVPIASKRVISQTILMRVRGSPKLQTWMRIYKDMRALWGLQSTNKSSVIRM